MCREVKPGIVEVGVRDYDREIFDELMPLPKGTSYNSYLIFTDTKIVLIDSVDPKFKDKYLAQLDKVLEGRQIDYVVSNHAEQDHSGSIPFVLEKYPSAKILTNKKCAQYLDELLHIKEDKVIVIEDGQEFNIGNKNLKFILTPWVHWPETMVTYLVEDKILFTCDFFGSHLATEDLFVDEESNIYEEVKRYYAEIMMPYRLSILKNLTKLRNIQIETIAPSHGPIHRNSKAIIDEYWGWVDGPVKKEVVIIYISMHGSSTLMADYLANKIREGGVEVKTINLGSREYELGVLAMEIVDASTIVFGTPTVMSDAHPLISYAAHIVDVLRPKTKFLSFFNTYNWATCAIERLQETTKHIKAELIPPVEIQGKPNDASYRELDRLAKDIVDKNNSLN